MLRMHECGDGISEELFPVLAPRWTVYLNLLDVPSPLGWGKDHRLMAEPLLCM